MEAMRALPFFWFFCWVIVCSGALLGQTAPRLTGIYGGGTVDPGQQVTLLPTYDGLTPTGVDHVWRKDGRTLEGQTFPTLELDAITALDAGTYSVVVSNAAGSRTASTTLTVRPAAAPAITVPPRSQTFEVGQEGAFTFTATGSFPRTYQWRKDGVPIPGETQASLWIPVVTTESAGSYSVEVRNALGATVSAAATLTINPARLPVLGILPAASGATVEGRRFSLFAPVAGGTSPYTYQWRKDGVAIAGATAGIFVLEGIRLADAGDYSVVVSNAAGSVASNALRVTVAPAQPPFKIRLENPGGIVGFAVELRDTRSLFEEQPTLYQWYKDGRALPGETTHTYRPGPLGLDDSGEYFVVATNIAGATTSGTVRVAARTANGAFDSPWRAAERVADLVYFAFAAPARIERYDLAADAWLPALPLRRAPTALAVHAGALYVAHGREIVRLALDGTGETALAGGFINEINQLAAWGGYLFAAEDNGTVFTVRLSDGARVSATPANNPVSRPVAVAAAAGVLYARNGSTLVSLRIMADGSLRRLDSRAQLSPVGGGERLLVSPDERRIVALSGSVFDHSSHELVGTLGGALDDVAWLAGGELAVLRGGHLHVHAAALHETHRLALGLAGRRLFLHGGEAVVFGALDAAGRPARRRAALAPAVPLAAPAPLAPERLGFTPDKVLVDRDGVVLLYSKLHRQVFRWSTAERRFLASLPVLDWLDHLAYSAVDHCLYLAHTDGRLSRVRLGAESPAAEPFATVPAAIRSLATAGELLVLDVDNPASSSQVLQVIAGRDGRWRPEGGGHSLDYTWNAAKRRLYHFTDNSSPNDLVYTEVSAAGEFTSQRDSPLHGGVLTRYPIRVTTDGSRVLLGSGKVFDGDSLAEIGGLPHAIDDAQWVGSRIVSGRRTAQGSEVQRWHATTYALERTAVLPGRLLALVALASERVGAVTVVDGLVHIAVLDAELAVLSRDAVRAPERLANLSARARVGQGDETLIPGFVIAGAEPKTVLIRASGPALAAFGVAGAIADPSFTVHDARGVEIGADDNWSAGPNASFLSTVNPRVGAFALPRASRDAAALLSLPPGAYTVQVRGPAATTGVALVEIYDGQDNQGESRLVNVATRARVGAGDEVLIAGVVVQADSPRRLLIRALGPSLAPFGVTGLLANPRLRVVSDGRLIAENDDWGRGGGSTPEEITLAGASAGAVALLPASTDAALVLDLPAGAYSVQVSGAEGASGVALVEVYEVR